jgi:hypothetical protein
MCHQVIPVKNDLLLRTRHLITLYP